MRGSIRVGFMEGHEHRAAALRWVLGLMDTLALVAVVIFVAAIALFAIEFWLIAHHQQTISERMQRLNARMGIQLLAGIYFLLGCLAGWFIAHFTSPPPN